GLERLAALTPSSRPLLFCHPFGQILGCLIAPGRLLLSQTFYYVGEVYTARRGPSLGNVQDVVLDALIARTALRATYCERKSIAWSGNVYTARRGPSFGNVHDADLAALLARPALRATYRERKAIACDLRHTGPAPPR